MAKEAKSLFAILQKECGQDQKERLLTPQETQQEAINQKLSADEQAQADRLVKSAEEKFKKASLLGTSPAGNVHQVDAGGQGRESAGRKPQHQGHDLRPAHGPDALQLFGQMIRFGRCP